MALIRWEPVGELNTIQSEMNRLFNTFFDQSPSTQGGGRERRWIPAMDLVESSDHYVLRADLPGVREDDVTIQLEENTLTIAGQRTVEHDQQEGYCCLERAIGAFSRSLTLPDAVNPDAVQAHFDRGVLRITIPKPEQKKPRQVEIQLTHPDHPKTIEGTGSAVAQAADRDPDVAVA